MGARARWLPPVRATERWIPRSFGALALLGGALLVLGPGTQVVVASDPSLFALRPVAVPPPSRAEVGLAARYAPIILFDQREPFLPGFVGYTIFRADAESGSFPRRVTLRPEFPQISAADARAIAALFPDQQLPHVPDLDAAFVIEYAIWWDWDIQHLYELEHAWSYVGADGRLRYAEASWHGSYFPMLWQGATPHEGDHPILYSQPGKHALVPNPELFTGSVGERENLRRTCLVKAGTGVSCSRRTSSRARSRRIRSATRSPTPISKSTRSTPRSPSHAGSRSMTGCSCPGPRSTTGFPSGLTGCSGISARGGLPANDPGRHLLRPR